MERLLRLVILTPKGAFDPIVCDDVCLVAADDAEGLGGGSVGIRFGHIPALIALRENSPVTAYLNGKTVFNGRVTKGVAEVASNVVTVIAEGAGSV